MTSMAMTTIPGPALRGRGALQGVAIVTLAMALYVWSLPWLTRGWGWALQMGVGALNLNALVSLQTIQLPWGLPALPRWTLVGPAAQPGLWGGVAQVTVLLAAGLALSRWRQTIGPWVPIAQLVLALSGLSVLLFGWGADALPQHLAQHTGDLFVFGVVMQGLVPLVLGLTFFPLEGRWHLRLAAVALTLGYFMWCLPVKILAHAWLIGHVGAAIMPLLYLCFGPVLDVLLFVAIYAWMACWSPPQP